MQGLQSHTQQSGSGYLSTLKSICKYSEYALAPLLFSLVEDSQDLDMTGTQSRQLSLVIAT